MDLAACKTTTERRNVGDNDERLGDNQIKLLGDVESVLQQHKSAHREVEYLECLPCTFGQYRGTVTPYLVPVPICL